jgi:hypothetical protein
MKGKGYNKDHLLSERSVFPVATVQPCILYDRDCIGCGECDRCDLDPNKICDNCMKCLQTGSDYRSVLIDGIVLEGEKPSPAGNP